MILEINKSIIRWKTNILKERQKKLFKFFKDIYFI